MYSNFKNDFGISGIEKLLEYDGYKNVLKYGTGKKRFCIWWGDIKKNIREDIKEIFNNQKNINGELVKIMLGWPAIKEGVSLLRVKYVHMIEPWWNWSKMDQIIGRAIRFCSHKDLWKNERNVKI